jgi:hypothetical protein
LGNQTPLHTGGPMLGTTCLEDDEGLRPGDLPDWDLGLSLRFAAPPDDGDCPVGPLRGLAAR